MKAIQKVCFCLGFLILLAANANAGRWLTRDPIEFMERDPKPATITQQANLYKFVDNNPINEVDPLGLWGVAFGNNSGSHYINVGWGNPNYYYSPSVYAPSQINGPASGLAIYMLGEGNPVPIGPDLQAALQDLQKNKPWPQTGNNCPNQPRHIGFSDYAAWNHPLDDFNVEFSLGHFDYSNNGITTSVSDNYAFPFLSNGSGISRFRNTPYAGIPGTSYGDSGSWPTP